MSKNISLGRAQKITSSGQFVFNNNQPKRGAAFINPKTNSSAIFVHGIPISAGDSLTIDVHPGETLANQSWDIDLNGNSEMYAAPLVYNN